MIADLLLAYIIDASVLVTRDIEAAVVYVQDQAREHDLAFPRPNTRIHFTVNPMGVPRGFYGYDDILAVAADNVSPCLITFIEPAAARSQAVIRHEILHCLGVPHSGDKRDLMYREALNDRLSKRELKLWKRK